MAFEPLNISPIGGNSRSGENQVNKNAPMGWGYLSKVDDVETVSGVGYFDSMNKLMAANQFIYCALTDNNVIFTVASVDRQLQQVTLATEFLQPRAPGAANVKEVFVEDDFLGEEVSGSIQLNSFHKFIIMDYVPLTKPLFTDPGDFAINEFLGTFLAGNFVSFLPPSPSTFYKAIIFLLEFKTLVISDSSAAEFPTVARGNNTFVEVDGLAPDIGSFMTLQQSSPYNFGSLGSAKNMEEVAINFSTLINNGALNIENVKDIIFTNSAFDMQDGAGSHPGETAFNIFGDNFPTFATMSALTFIVPDGEAALFIDPYISGISTLLLNDIKAELLGSGEFFKTGDMRPIQAFADNSVSGTVSSVTDEGNDQIRITTGGAHSMVAGQKVTLSSMTESGYDGDYTIDSVPGGSEFIVDATFTATSTGNYSSDSVVVDSMTHGQLDGQTLLIENTVNYNGGAKIYGVTANTFNIDRTWESAEIGTRGTVVSISDQGGGTARITTGLAHGLLKSQYIFLTEMTDSDYDGEFFILAVPSTTEVDIQLDVSGGTAIGDWDASDVRVLQFNTGSLTGTDPRMILTNVEGLPDSQFIFSGTIDSIFNPRQQIIIVQNNYIDFDFTGVKPILDGTEKFSLVNSVNLEFRYDGLAAKTFSISGFISASKNGASQRQYIFGLFISKDGGATFNQSVDVAETTVEFDAGIISAPFGGALVLNPGDHIKLKQRTVGHTINFNVATFSFIGS